MFSLSDIAIIAVNYNQTALTLEMLQSIEEAGAQEACEVWVVDNASQVDDSAVLKQSFPWVKTLRSNVNLGFAGGNNLAMRKSDKSFFFLLNNDALLEPGVLEGLLVSFRQNPNLGAVSPVIYDYPLRGKTPIIQYAGATPVSSVTGRNTTCFAGQPAGNQPSGITPTAYTHGAAMMVSKSAIMQAGLLEESFFLYYEELDWCDRIRAAGYEIAVHNDLAVWHRESVTTGIDSAFKTFWINRARILYMRRNKHTIQALLFGVFYLIGVLPLHGIKHLLAGRKQHAKALLEAFTSQPPIQEKNRNSLTENATPSKPSLAPVKA